MVRRYFIMETVSFDAVQIQTMINDYLEYEDENARLVQFAAVPYSKLGEIISKVHYIAVMENSDEAA